MASDGSARTQTDLRTYIPFLRRMIENLSRRTPDVSKDSQKDKLESLLEVITCSETRLRPETHQRCEKVLRKLYLKFEGDNPHTHQDGSYVGSEVFQEKDSARLNSTRDYSLPFRNPDPDEEPSTAVMYHREAATWGRPSSVHYDRWCENNALFKRSCEPGTERFPRDVHLDKPRASTLALSEEVTLNASSSRETLPLGRHSGSAPLFNPESSTSITKPKPVFPVYIEGQRRSRDPRSASRMLRTNSVDSSYSGQRENRPESFNTSSSLIPVHLYHQSYRNWEMKSDARNTGTDRDISVPVGSLDSIRQSSLKQNVKHRLDHNTTELERSYTSKPFEKRELLTPVRRENNNVATVERSEHAGINFAPVSSITICGKNQTESVAGGFRPTGDVLGRGTNSVDSANHPTQPLRAIPNPPSMANCQINQAALQTPIGNPETGKAEEAARNLELKLERHNETEMQTGAINKIPVAISAAFGELRPQESFSSQERWEKTVAAKNDSSSVGLKDSVQQPSSLNAAPSEVKMGTRMPEPPETFSSRCATEVMQSRHKLIPPCYSQPESKSEDWSNVVPVVASVAVGKLRRRRMSECQKRRRRAATMKHNLTAVGLKDGVERTPPQNASAERKVEVPDPPEIFSSPCTVEVMQSDRELKSPFHSQPERKSDENSNEVLVAERVAVGELSRRKNLGKKERLTRAAAMKREMAVVGSKNGAGRAPPQIAIPVELKGEAKLLDPPETFSSPLNSLYMEPKLNPIGRGYGPQKCKSNSKNHTNIKTITIVSENASTETPREQAKYISQRGINDRIVSSSVMFSKHSDVPSTVATSILISEGKSGTVKETLWSSETKEPINQVPPGVSDTGRTPSPCLVENMSLHNLQNGKGQHQPLEEKGERPACPLISCYSSLTDTQSCLGKPVQETSCLPTVTEQQESEKLAEYLRLGQKSSVSQTATGQPVAKSTFSLENMPADINGTNHKTLGEKEFWAHNISQSTLENPSASSHYVNSGVPETVVSSKNSCQPETVSLNLIGDYLKRILPPEEANEVIERLRLSNETCVENSTQSEDLGILSVPERAGPVFDSSSSSSADVERIGIKDSEKPSSLTAVPAEDQNHSACASHPVAIHSTKQSSFTPNQEKGKGCIPLKTSKKGVSALEIEGLRLDAAKLLEGLDVPGKRRSRSTLKSPSYTVFVPERVDMELENLSSPSAAGTEATNISHRREKNEKRKAAVSMTSVPVVKMFIPESFFEFEPQQVPSQVSNVLDSKKSDSNEQNDSPHTYENSDLLFQEKEASVVRTPEHSSDCTATRNEKEDPPSKIVMSRSPKNYNLLVSRDSASNLSKAPANPVISVVSKKRKSSMGTPIPKRKKGFVRETYPLHDLDLCNLREIYMGDTEEIPCHECTYVGQNIVHHYVNEHRGIEVPYSKVPSRNWNPPRVSLSHLPLQRYSKGVSLNPVEISSSLTNGGSALSDMFRHSLGCSEDKEHLRSLSSTLDYKFRCLLCNKEELGYVDMYDHVTEHTGEFRFRCDHCGHRVAQQKDMVDHMRKLHELQDPPLYHTDPVAQDGYFIRGWVCCSCHYLQICEENMRKHLESGSCQNCRCVNLSEPVFDNRNSQSGGLTKAALIVQGVSARFLRRYSEAKKLAVTKHSWTRNLGSKLRQKLSDYEVGVVNDYDHAKEVFPLLIRVKPEIPNFDFEPLNEDRIDKSRIFQTSLMKLVNKLVERVNGVEKAVAENAIESATGNDRVGWLPTVNDTTSVDIIDDNENFLKVASVISLDPRRGVSEEIIATARLHTPDSRSSCDSVTCSTLTFQRGECEFPSTIPHNRANLAATLKDPSCYAIMMLREYVTDFFKCMSVRCTFTSNFQEQFLEHINAHEKQNRNNKIVLQVDIRNGDQGNHISCLDFYLCSYCPFVGNSSVDLVEHLVSSHGRKRSYQCSGCFFRGVSVCHVQHHITQAHPYKPETAVLQCDPICDSDTSLNLQEITAKDILHYRCTIEGCNYSCLSQNAYESHLCEVHSDVSSLSCSICGLVTSIGDITDHTTLHGLGLYQCPYCYYGSNSFDNIISHVTLSHPFGVVKVFVRDATKESSSESKEEINSKKSPVSALKNLCHSAVKVELDPSLWAATEHTRESTFQLGSEQRLDTVPVDAKSTCGDAEISGDTSTTVGTRSLELVNYGVRIGSAVPSSCSIFGLTGHDLYKCGNVGCHFSAPDVEELKEHLCICDLARDCSTLKCFHCLKQFAAVPHLLDHLRAHGPKPYSCGVCQKRFDHVCRFGSHMKMNHRSLETTITTFESSSGTNHAQVYNVFPEDVIKNLNDLKALNISERVAFTCNDIPLIPAKSIVREPLYCEDCGYSTKVTKNLIHHLMLHTDHSLESYRIPTTDPVNQMTNSTASVCTPQGTSAERGEHITDSKLTKYVPRSRRFTCAISGCRAVLQNEKQLSAHFVKHSSLIFHCPHCSTDDKSYTKADYFTHLKMHGPCLYKCQHCSLYHWQRMSIKQHSARDHPNMPCLDVVIRELQGKKETTGNSHNSWKCTLCKRMTSKLPEIVNHVSTQHGLSNQFQCVWCTEGFEKLALIETHYSESHPGKDAVVAVAFLRMVAKETDEDVSEENLPLWSRSIVGPRYIRKLVLASEGEEILERRELSLLAEPGPKPQTPVAAQLLDNASSEEPAFGFYGLPSNKLFCCPRCNWQSNRRDSFRRHLYWELKYNRFQCGSCEMRYISRERTKKHIKTKHHGLATVTEHPKDLAIVKWVNDALKFQTERFTKGGDHKSSAQSKPNVAAKTKVHRTAGSTTVFSCGVFKLNFSLEEEILTHQERHPGKPLRYRTIKIGTSTSPATIETEVLFECPVCFVCFLSREETDKHLVQHEVAAKCAKCDYLILPTLGIKEHWNKEHSASGDIVVETVPEEVLKRRVRIRKVTRDVLSGGSVQGTEALNKSSLKEMIKRSNELVTIQSHQQETEGRCQVTLNLMQTTAKREQNSKEDGFSFYGEMPEPVDLGKVFTYVTDSCTEVKITVDTLALTIPLFPLVKLRDCNCQ